MLEIEDSVFKMAEQISKIRYDGHFTLFKFTGNWRFCFGTFEYYCHDKNCNHFSMDLELTDPKTGKSRIEEIYSDDYGHWRYRLGQLHSGKTKEEAMLKAIILELQHDL